MHNEYRQVQLTTDIQNREGVEEVDEDADDEMNKTKPVNGKLKVQKRIEKLRLLSS